MCGGGWGGCISSQQAHCVEAPLFSVNKSYIKTTHLPPTFIFYFCFKINEVGGIIAQQTHCVEAPLFSVNKSVEKDLILSPANEENF